MTIKTEAPAHSSPAVVSQAERAHTAAAEFRKGWPLLIACLFGGTMMGAPFFAISHFMAPWQREFGWTEIEVSFALSLSLLGLAVFAPIVGTLVDRFGVRPVVTVSMSVLGGGYLVQSQIQGQLWMLYATTALIALAGSGSSIVTLSRAIAMSFDTARGLALAIGTSASVLTGLAIPPLLLFVMPIGGWRLALMSFGLLSFLLLPIVAWGLSRSGGSGEAVPHNARPKAGSAGIKLSNAARSWRFWTLACSFFLLTFASAGAYSLVYKVMLDKGMSVASAVFAQSLMAVGLGLGRLTSGFLVDRMFAPTVYLMLCLTASAGLLALAFGPVSTALAACLLVSIAQGSEFDILAYKVSRYFGMRDYARIFGWLYATAVIGSVVAPIFLSWQREASGSYAAGLSIAAAAAATAGVILLRLGRYPDHRAIDST